MSTPAQLRPRLPRALSFLEHRNAWLLSAIGTAAMLLFFVLTLDRATLSEVWRSISLRVICLTVVLLGVNSLLDGLWLTTITRGSARRRDAYRVVAWQMLVSSVLPARLGDVAWMYFVHRWLKQPAARAVFVTFYHRLQDFIVVSLLLVLSLILARSQVGGAPALVIAVALCVAMGLACATLGHLLALLAAALLRLHRRFHRRWLRVALEHVLRIRIWYRHRLQRDQVVKSFIVIALRWVAILAAVALIIATLVPSVTAGDSFFLANAYIYLGIVPVQSVGGFGTGEAGLAWILTYYGLPLAKASAVGLLLRLLINLVHLMLCPLVLVLLGLLVRWERRAV